MFLIVGLGNPGDKYKNNRHNVGYMFIDYMIKWLNCYMAKKTKSYLTMQPSNHATILLAKSLTFMNLSGKAVKQLIRYCLPAGKAGKLDIRNLIIVHDDLDIPIGKFKIQKGIGPKLHNGIESIENSLGTKEFWRIRVGVDNRQQTSWIDGETYVLKDFLPQEKKIITSIFPKIVSRFKNEFWLI